MTGLRNRMWGAVAILVAVLGLLVCAPEAEAECTFTKTIVKLHKSGSVRGTFKGTFEPGDFEFEPDGQVLIQIGIAQELIPMSRFKGKAKRAKYTYKGNWKQIVKKAVFDLKKGKVLVICQSNTSDDYRPGMHAGLATETLFAFEIPVDPAKKKTKIKQPIVGRTGGILLAGAALGGGGGDIVAPGVIVTAGPGALRTETDIDITSAVLPAGLPSGVTPAGPPVDIDVGGGAGSLEAPLTIQFEYNGAGAGPGDVVAVLHYYDHSGGGYDPATVTGVNAGTVTVQCRSFSVFVPVILQAAAVPPTYTVSGFTPATSGWSVANFGEYLAPGGNGFGMSSYCSWFHGAKPTESLATKYTGDAARTVARRAHLTQSQYWAVEEFEFQEDLGAPLMAQIIRAQLSLFGDPGVLVLRNDDSKQAGVCYGYDETGFLFYDPDIIGQEQRLPYSEATGFGTYGGNDRYAFVTLPTLGRNDDFDAIYEGAEDEFTPGSVTITAPLDAAEITTRSLTITGTVTNPLWDGAMVFVSGVRYDTQIVGQAFEITVPLTNGDIPITVLAGMRTGDGSSFAPGSGMDHVDITATLPTADLLVTLRWLQNNTDMDLYVYEPDGEVCWYSNESTTAGGVLDIDDTDGYGPEHYTVGTVEPGVYTVRAHYYSDDGVGTAATGTVDIVLDEGLPTQQIMSFPFDLATSNSGNSDPTGTGPDWVDIADVDVINGTITPR